MCKSKGCDHKNKQFLSDAFPHLAKELVGVDPKTVTTGSTIKQTWLCDRGHNWEAPVYSRVNGNGCPFCSGKRPIPGKTDMATTHPELGKQLVGLDPKRIIAGTGKKLKWRCEIGHEWEARGCHRINGSGCPYCCGRKAISGKTDLKSTHPLLAKQLIGTNPETIKAGTMQLLRWRCSNGHEWTATGSNRVKGDGCPYCSGRFAIKGKTDLLTTHKELAFQLVGTDPSTISAGSARKVKWRCASGHEWFAIVSNRAKGIGCPSCSKSGFKPEKPSLFYLIYRSDRFKFGIANYKSGRLEKHKKSGWEVLETIDLVGRTARALEKKVKGSFKAKGIPLGQFSEGFDGRTESWRRSDLSVRTIRGLCRKLRVNLAEFLAM